MTRGAGDLTTIFAIGGMTALPSEPQQDVDSFSFVRFVILLMSFYHI